MERQSEIEYQRATVTIVTDRESDREGKSDSEREREGGCLRSVRTEKESGRETERDTQRRGQKD